MENPPETDRNRCFLLLSYLFFKSPYLSCAHLSYPPVRRAADQLMTVGDVHVTRPESQVYSLRIARNPESGKLHFRCNCNPHTTATAHSAAHVIPIG
eukprot:4403769-Prymnesium_polylepis.1